MRKSTFLQCLIRTNSPMHWMMFFIRTVGSTQLKQWGPTCLYMIFSEKHPHIQTAWGLQINSVDKSHNRKLQSALTASCLPQLTFPLNRCYLVREYSLYFRNTWIVCVIFILIGGKLLREFTPTVLLEYLLFTRCVTFVRVSELKGRYTDKMQVFTAVWNK